MKRYTDAAGTPRTLTPVQYQILLRAYAQRRPGNGRGHMRSPDTLAARLLAERGVVTVAEWHCPLDPRCITGLTPLGRSLVQQ